MGYVPDYMAALADLEQYPDPESLSAGINDAYAQDVAIHAQEIADRDAQNAELRILNGQLQTFNASLLARVGVGPEDGGDGGDEDEDDEDDAPDEEAAEVERGENITLDDLLEKE